MNEYVFRIPSREPFFLSAVPMAEELSEQDTDECAAVFVALLLGVMQPAVGKRVREMLYEAGELGRKMSEIGKAADAEDGSVSVRDVAEAQNRSTKFADWIEQLASQRLIGGPPRPGSNQEVEDFE